MLLVYPLREVLRFLPVVIGLLLAGSATGNDDIRWQLFGIGIPVALGLLRYLTTTFRVTDRKVELRRGLVDRHLLSTRIERVRTVELTASPFHRVLGLTTVRIGTGTASTKDEDSLALDGLPVPRARAMREALLRAARPETVDGEPGVADGAAAARQRVVLRLDPRWARFAPLTSAGLVLAAGVLGVGSQVLEGLDLWETLALDVEVDEPGSGFWLLVVPSLLVGVALVVSVLAVTGYLVTNWGFTLTRSDADRSWHLTRGLLTTRETSLDAERVSGVTVGEPLGLRVAGGGRLAAIVTGLDREKQGSSVLVPPAPRRVVEGVAGEVLGTLDPLTEPLRSHGPRARTRRWTRALVPSLVVTAALVAAVAAGGWTWLLGAAVLLPVAAVAVAVDRVRSLGHALVGRYFVARSGSLFRQRQALATDAVIGWNLRASWFQRRAGLTTLVATTAGGPQSVTAIDVPEADAVEVAAAAVPGLVAQFLA